MYDGTLSETLCGSPEVAVPAYPASVVSRQVLPILKSARIEPAAAIVPTPPLLALAEAIIRGLTPPNCDLITASAVRFVASFVTVDVD